VHGLDFLGAESIPVPLGLFPYWNLVLSVSTYSSLRLFCWNAGGLSFSLGLIQNGDALYVVSGSVDYVYALSRFTGLSIHIVNL
jgi:hypothetical protein